MSNPTVYSLVLAGGASSRLFPLNKILADLCGTGESLLQQAMGRAQLLTERPNIRILAVESMAEPISKQLKLPPQQIHVDPIRRGTWPAILWAMTYLPPSSSQAVMAVLTGDHLIPKTAAFRKAAQQAIRLAADHSAFVMLGVEPNHIPQTWTGFGVFRTDRHARVTRFEEKPSLDQATTMIRAGQWQWNSGMFFFRVATAVEALQRYQPEMYRVYMRMCEAVSLGDRRRAEMIYSEFPEKIRHPLQPKRLVDNTIDFAVMTPLVQSARSHMLRVRSEVTALAVTGGLPQWTDIGQWGALRDVLKKDREGNVRLGNVTIDASVHQSILAADRGFSIEARGIRDLVVSVSAAGALVLPVGQLADIKMLVQKAPLSSGRRLVSAGTGVQVVIRGRRLVVTGRG